MSPSHELRHQLPRDGVSLDEARQGPLAGEALLVHAEELVEVLFHQTAER